MRTARVEEVRQGTALVAPVLEAFVSIQGEGAFAGEPQVFLRLSGCPLRCRWCDTPGSWGVPPAASAGASSVALDEQVALRAGHIKPRSWASPLQVATWLATLDPERRRSLSVTGGEPLLWPDFILELRSLLGEQRIHLETAGAHPVALARVLDAVDHVSLDLKLPADLDAPVPLEQVSDEGDPSSAVEWAEVRAQCLDLVRERDACGKIIVAGGRRATEYVQLLDDVAAIAAALPVYIQPVTPVGDARAPDRALLDAVVGLALDRRLHVRVMPQLHPMLQMP